MKLLKGISIFSSVTFVGLVVAGTAAASAVAFPKQVERLSQTIGEEGQALTTKASGIYREGLVQLATLFHVPHDGEGGNANGKGSGVGSSQGDSSGSSVQSYSPTSFQGNVGRPSSPPIGRIPSSRDFSAVQSPTGAGTGSVVNGEAPGSSLSVGSLIAQGNNPTTTNTLTSGSGPTTLTITVTKTQQPAATPIPGAIWLLGTGIASLFVSQRSRNKKR